MAPFSAVANASDSNAVDSWADEPTETLVTIELKEAAEGTALTLLHERFDTDESRDNHAQGWSDCFDRMPEWLKSNDSSAA